MSTLSDLNLIASGKVREIYDLGDELLIVASDRISTYDVVHPTPIRDKGSVLTGLSTFWFERTAGILPNHLVSVTDGVPAEARGQLDPADRAGGLIVLPPGARDVAANDALDREHLQAPHHKAAAAL